jgi:putative ABC transport system substrate-binding protein
MRYTATFARDGGLLSYGVDRVDFLRRAASYVDRILRGEKPGDLPVQFPVTARAFYAPLFFNDLAWCL